MTTMADDIKEEWMEPCDCKAGRKRSTFAKSKPARLIQNNHCIALNATRKIFIHHILPLTINF